MIDVRVSRDDDDVDRVPPARVEIGVWSRPDGEVTFVALTAGQNQIVAINRGSQDGLERGHVLALWRAGTPGSDRTGDKPQPIQLPDERSGLLFVFRVFDRVSYALIVSAFDPIRPGDRFSEP